MMRNSMEKEIERAMADQLMANEEIAALIKLFGVAAYKLDDKKVSELHGEIISRVELMLENIHKINSKIGRSL